MTAVAVAWGTRVRAILPESEAFPTTSGGSGTGASPPCSGSTPSSSRSSLWPADSRQPVPNDALGLVVDLSGVRYIDSVGVRMLFTFVRSLHASRQGKAIALPHGAPVRKLLKITHLDEGGTPQY